jgi:thiol:disulfide interchange protein DsbD
MPKQQNYLIVFLLFLGNFAGAQPSYVNWDFTIEENQSDTLTILMTAEIDPGWYVYSQYLENDEGPIATRVSFDEEESLTFLGKPEETGELTKGFDEIFGMNISKYKNKMEIRQRLLLPKGTEWISGSVLFMCCDHEMCLPPTEVPFSIAVE